MSSNPIFKWDYTQVDVVFSETGAKTRGLAVSVPKEIVPDGFFCTYCVCDKDEKRRIGRERRVAREHLQDGLLMADTGCGRMWCIGSSGLTDGNKLPKRLMTPAGQKAEVEYFL